MKLIIKYSFPKSEYPDFNIYIGLIEEFPNFYFNNLNDEEVLNMVFYRKLWFILF